MKPLCTLLQLPTSTPYVCSNCLRTQSPRLISRHQPYSTTTNPPPPPSACFTRLPSRRLISLCGPDASSFLQGAITANILSRTNPRLNTGFYTAFLNAQGRLLHDVFIYRDWTRENEKGNGGQGWLVECDAQEVEGLGRWLKRFKLRAKFEMRVLPEEEQSIWSCWGEQKEWTASTFGGDGGGGGGREEIGCMDHRAPGMGRRVVLPGGKKPEVDMEESTQDAYRIRRYLMGVPEGQGELIKEHALPQESCIDFMGGIDYRKGCYVGQELTIRTHHTGVVRKRILPVMIYGIDEVAPERFEYVTEKEYGAERIPREASIGRFEKSGRSAGKFLAGVGNIGLGLCRLETMTNFPVQGSAGAYKEGDEFKLEWTDLGGVSEMAKVKAFVPSWHHK